ncbi:glycosyltransferase family 2 protein [Citreimonas salinaria]|nr:glycosyltransferase family 2 protein [Citreimonas salinaria]
MPGILVIILNYRTAPMTLRAARAALAAMQGLKAELIIVDNASGDGSDLALAQALAQEDWARSAPVRLILSDVNNGFGAGNNIGMRAGMSDGTQPDYVYLLNSDAFPEADAIATLVAYLEAHPEAGIAGSYTQGEDGAPHETAFRFPSVWSEIEDAARTGPVTRLLRRHVVSPGIPAESGPVDWLAGASMMIRRSVLDRIGAFDETFFLYFEETDLCRRAADAGHERHFVRESRVVHIGSASTGLKRRARVPAYWFDSRRHYFRKTHGLAYACAATLGHLAGGALWRLRCVLGRRRDEGPDHFLRDLAAHDLAAAFGSRPRRRRRGVTPMRQE